MCRPSRKNSLHGRTGIPIILLLLVVFLGIHLHTAKAVGASGGFLGFEDARQHKKQLLDDTATRALGVHETGSDDDTLFDSRAPVEEGAEHWNQRHKLATAQLHASFLEQPQAAAQSNRTHAKRQVTFVASALSGPPLVVFQDFSLNNYKAAGEAGVSPRTVRVQPFPAPGPTTTTTTTTKMNPESSIASTASHSVPVTIPQHVKPVGPASSQ